MTAANVTALVEVRTARTSTRHPVIEIAGVRWPAYKIHAVLVAAVAALLTFAFIGTGQAAALVSGAALVTVWWAERVWFARPRRS